MGSYCGSVDWAPKCFVGAPDSMSLFFLWVPTQRGRWDREAHGAASDGGTCAKRQDTEFKAPVQYLWAQSIEPHQTVVNAHF